MTFEDRRQDWQEEPVGQEEERPSGRRRGHLLGILLCLLLTGAGAGLLFRDMGRDYRHGVYRCEGGRMLEEPAVPDPVKTAETAAGIEVIAQQHPEIPQYMMLVPAAAYTQERFLPEGVRIRDQGADLTAIHSSMPASLHWIDLTELFSEHEGEKLFYATDPRLTGWGSRYAAKAALEGMEAEIPEGKDTCYLLSDSFQGTLAKDDLLTRQFLDKKTERVEIYVPEGEVPYYRVDAATGSWSGSMYDSSAVAGDDPMNVFFGGERPLTEIYTAAVNGEILLVVGDTIADSVVPRFVSSYEQIIFMHPARSAATVEKMIKKYHPTRILYLYGANVFMKDRALLHALGR